MRKKMQDFDTGQRFADPQLAGRLNRAYVLYDGKPKQVNMVGDGSYKARIYDPGQKEAGQLIDVQEDPLLDLCSPELGYMNTKNGDALYIYRRPLRQWHYLYEGNCSSWSLQNQRNIGCNQPQFYCKEFGDMLSGKYPPYKKLLRECLDKQPFILTKAFDRYFALHYSAKALVLYYRDDKIAKYDMADKVWVLDKKFDYPTIINNLEMHGLEFGE